MSGKSALACLIEAEEVINNNITKIRYVMNRHLLSSGDPTLLPEFKEGLTSWHELVRIQEMKRKTARFEEQKRQRDDNDRIEKELKARNNELKQIRVVKKVGKSMMGRSEKRKIKEVEKKVHIDEDT